MQEQAIAEPVPLCPAAFWLCAGRRLDEVIRETAEDNSSNATSGTEKEATVHNKAVQVARNRAYGLCILRVVCPDKSVLQVHFRAGDRGEYVETQLAPLWAKHVQRSRWYVYQSPPLRRLAPKETLVAAGLAPGASMYLGFEGEKPGPPFLEAGLMQQLGPAPHEDHGGAQSPSGGNVLPLGEE
mmetsp:Transcript_87794/g.204328  ORF Transcript_87794/g.204328 Transcript_87794/m.204328 type:complete len:184 (-) Transcript_87794:94-645(-)